VKARGHFLEAEMFFIFGTVTVEATQLTTDVRAVISDSFGQKKEILVRDDRVERVPWAVFAENHMRWSQAQTRRN
jgi:hypothetical protein